jgi:hemoglobin
MYERIGGQTVVTTAVSVLYDRVTEDAILREWFVGADLTRLRAHQRAFVAAALDGPQLYSGRSVGLAHASLGIDDAAFTTFAAHVNATLHDLGVASDVLALVSARIEQLRSTVVTVTEFDLRLDYQVERHEATP